eukprot:Amastigsp_a174967_1656.p3 type:complete len:101 gc:universal Amastigsp_a174967_1656:164-466(+)
MFHRHGRLQRSSAHRSGVWFGGSSALRDSLRTRLCCSRFRWGALTTRPRGGVSRFFCALFCSFSTRARAARVRRLARCSGSTICTGARRRRACSVLSRAS